MFTIYSYSDGYFALGYEGKRRTFTADEAVVKLLVTNELNNGLSLMDLRIRKSDVSIEQHFRGE